jgi:hypothetical protein
MGQRQTKAKVQPQVEINNINLLGGTIKRVSATLANGDRTVACFDQKNVLIMFYVNEQLRGYRIKSGDFYLIGQDEDPGTLYTEQ